MKKTFTAAIIGTPDLVGDVFLPGCLKKTEGKKVPITKEFNNSLSDLISFVDSIKEVGYELKVTAEVPEPLFHCTPAIGFQVIKSEPNEFGGRTIHEMKIMEVGLCSNNTDSRIRPISQQ